MKYYLAINEYGVRSLFTNEDLDAFAENHNGNRNPFELFSGTGNNEEDIVTDIYVCELTNQGLIYTKKLDRETLQEIDL